MRDMTGSSDGIQTAGSNVSKSAIDIAAHALRELRAGRRSIDDANDFNIRRAHHFDKANDVIAALCVGGVVPGGKFEPIDAHHRQ